MRRVYRSGIDFSTRCDLAARQKKVTSKEKGRIEWSAYRRSASSDAVVDELRKMNGRRQRCVYCCDSRSADVDHFIPIAVDFSRTFSWKNFILVCPECNRRKSARFPVDAEGGALLINPTLEDPWDFLVLDTKSGYLAARFLEDDFDPKGDATIEIMSCVNHEAVVEGRRRVISRYYEALESLLISDNPIRLVPKLIREVREDEYGVGEWFARREGREEPQFQELRNQFPLLWRQFVREVCHT